MNRQYDPMQKHVQASFKDEIKLEVRCRNGFGTSEPVLPGAAFTTTQFRDNKTEKHATK
jgi:hypothetical protein